MSVTWLHVSDFHIRGGDAYDRDVVLRALVKSMQDFRERGRIPDVIFATGDIAHSGKAHEYDLATQFFDALLAAAGVDRRHLFVIPGNHDVDRELGVGLARTLDSREQADAYFNPAIPKLHVTQKQGAFLQWYNRYFDGIRAFPVDSTCGPVEMLDIRGLRMGILPLNSALFCQGDDDHEKLWIGRRCLETALDKLRTLDAHITVALVHHPLEWLDSLERSNIRAELLAHVDAILRGHLHEMDVESVVGASGSVLHVAAGAAYQTRRWPNRALYATLERDRLTVFPIRYEDQPREVWTVDPSLFPAESHYQKSFSLPIQTSVFQRGSLRLALGAPFQASPLPSHYVRRPQVISDLKTPLLSTIAPSRMLALTAIHGMGGIGKSTTAADLAYDPEVQARFSDGILWVTLGHQPDLLSLLSNWIISGLHDYNFRPTTVLAAKTHLHTLLQDKAVLLIIDDVWRDDHANAFAVGGPRCRVLMTTRDAIVARAVNADVYPLDVMQADQALALLQLRVGHVLEGREREAALALAELVGYLPLALELAAGQVADGLPWSEFITVLRKEIGDLRRLEWPGVDEVVDEGARKRLSLRASLQLSVNRLSDERRRRFAWLGVLPEDAAITAMMAATLWDVHVSHATDTLSYLRLKALLLPGVDQPDGTPTYRVHDLLHHMAREILTSLPPAGLGLDLADVHVALLHRYQAGSRHGLWSTIPDDGYIHQYLTWHMEKAGRHDLIYALLRETSSDGGNAWYNKQDALGQLGWYLDDVRRAWQLAEADLSVSCATSPATATPDDPRDGPALPVRYALIIASLISLAHRIPHHLLARLVEAKLWTSAQALAYACQMPYGTDRAWALRSLAPHLSYSLVQQALGFVLASPTEDIFSHYDNPQVEAVATLGQRLAELGHADDIPRAVGMLTSEDNGEGALAGLLKHLATLGHHEVALQAARAIKDPGIRVKALLEAVGDMSGSERDALLGHSAEIMPSFIRLAFWLQFLNTSQAASHPCLQHVAV
jgi:predicted phosphodiesterase